MESEKLWKSLVSSRWTLIKGLLRKIKLSSSGYYLLIGERGMGKTHLLHLLYHGIREEKELRNTLLPIKLMEEEYSIASVEDLLFRMMQEVGGESLGDAKRMVKSFKELKERVGKRVVVVIDNLDRIFLQIDDLNNLRLLFKENAFLMIGSSLPPKKKESLFSPFEFIQIPELSPSETEELIFKHAKLRGVEEGRFDDYKQSIKAVTHLIGGNPRYILMVYRIFEYGLVDLEEVLKKLLDELTPYFQSEMNKLSPQQRKILGILASESKPLTPTALSKKSRLKANIVTSQVKRLMDFGYITPFSEKRRKAVFYEVNEKIIRVWHEMRTEEGRKRISNFLRFLELWYTPKESLEEVVRGEVEFMEEEAGELRYTEHQSRVALLMRRGEEEKAQREVKRLRRREEWRDALEEEAILHFLRGDREREVVALNKLIELNPNSPAPLFNRGVCLIGLGRYKEALKDFDMVTYLIPQFAEAWLYQGIVLKKLGKYDDALGKIEQALKKNEKLPEAWFNKATILMILRRYWEALPAFERAGELRKDFAGTYFNRGIAFLLLGKYDDALREMVASFKIWERVKDASLRKALRQIIGLNLILALQYGIKREHENARKYLKEAFAYEKYIEKEDFLELLFVLFKQLISKKQWELIEEFLKMILKEKFAPQQLFNPLSLLLAYLKEGHSVLFSQQIEIREFVMGVVSSLNLGR